MVEEEKLASIARAREEKCAIKIYFEKKVFCGFFYAIMLRIYVAEVIIDVSVQNLQNWFFGDRSQKKKEWSKISLDANFDTEKSFVPFQKAWSSKT